MPETKPLSILYAASLIISISIKICNIKYYLSQISVSLDSALKTGFITLFRMSFNIRIYIFYFEIFSLRTSLIITFLKVSCNELEIVGKILKILYSSYSNYSKSCYFIRKLATERLIKNNNDINKNVL